MSGWLWVAAAFGVLAAVFVLYPALVAGRDDDEQHGRLEEQQR